MSQQKGQYALWIATAICWDGLFSVFLQKCSRKCMLNAHLVTPCAFYNNTGEYCICTELLLPFTTINVSVVTYLIQRKCIFKKRNTTPLDCGKWHWSLWTIHTLISLHFPDIMFQHHHTYCINTHPYMHNVQTHTCIYTECTKHWEHLLNIELHPIVPSEQSQFVSSPLATLILSGFNKWHQ